MPRWALQAAHAAKLHEQPSLQGKRKGKGLPPLSSRAAFLQDYLLFLLREGQHVIHHNAMQYT